MSFTDPTPPVPITATNTNAPQPTLEQKITAAVAQSAQIIAEFSPTVAAIIDAGLIVEPDISGLVRLFAALFHHHQKAAASGN